MVHRRLDGSSRKFPIKYRDICPLLSTLTRKLYSQRRKRTQGHCGHFSKAQWNHESLRNQQQSEKTMHKPTTVVENRLKRYHYTFLKIKTQFSQYIFKTEFTVVKTTFTTVFTVIQNETFLAIFKPLCKTLPRLSIAHLTNEMTIFEFSLLNLKSLVKN